MNQKATHAMLHTGAVLAASLAVVLPAQATTANVPEPNSLSLIGAAVMSAVLLARYLKKK